MTLTKTPYSMIQGAPINVLDFGADPTGNTDSHAAITAALAAPLSTPFATSIPVYFPTGLYRVSQPIMVSRQSQRIFGDGPNSTIIGPTGNFSGSATIRFNSYSGLIEDLQIGGIPGLADAILVENASLSAIKNCHVRFGEAGIRLQKGNWLNWTNIYAEGCNTGFLVEPTTTDTNGCTMVALRAYASNEWGLDVRVGVGGHFHSTWDVAIEGGVNGARIAGGFYNMFNIYSESNSGEEFDLTASGSNYFTLRNPDNETELFGNNGPLAWGIQTIGANMYFDGQWAPDRVRTISFDESGGALLQAGTKTWVVNNTSSPPQTALLILSFLDYAPVGFRARVYKIANTAGFTISSFGTGITLLGEVAGDFGAFPTTVACFEVTKINASQAIINRY